MSQALAQVPPRPKTRAPGTWTHDDFNNHCAGLLDYAARSLRRSQESAKHSVQKRKEIVEEKELLVTRDPRSSRRLQVLAKKQNSASSVKVKNCEKTPQAALFSLDVSRSRMQRLQVLSRKKASSLNAKPKQSSLRPSNQTDITNPFNVAFNTSDRTSSKV
jgi:hypothetical protein